MWSPMQGKEPTAEGDATVEIEDPGSRVLATRTGSSDTSPGRVPHWGEDKEQGTGDTGGKALGILRRNRRRNT